MRSGDKLTGPELEEMFVRADQILRETDNAQVITFVMDARSALAELRERREVDRNLVAARPRNARFAGARRRK